jgi:molecular chaperone GrpE
MADQAPPVAPSPGEAEKPAAAEAPALTRAEFDALKAERDKLNDQWLRAKAELSNYQKRVDRDRGLHAAHMKRDFVEALLPALDGLDLSLRHAEEKGPDPLAVEGSGPFSDALLEGVKAARDAVEQALVAEGVERIPAEAGRGYDPDLHEVAGVVERADLPEGSIVEELRAGYRIGKLVIRHSSVLVAKPPAEKPKSEIPEDEPKSP